MAGQLPSSLMSLTRQTIKGHMQTPVGNVSWEGHFNTAEVISFCELFFIEGDLTFRMSRL